MSNNIDHIFYINLDKRTDRKEEIEGELNKMELSYERFPAIYNKIGIAGCGYSHLEVLKTARDRGYKNVLIFEDDFMFLIEKDEFEDYLKRFFETVDNKFDVCFLSYNTHQFRETPELPFMKRVSDCQTASGYIVNQHYYSKIIELYEHAIPLLEQTDHHWLYANDIVWKKLQVDDTWLCFEKRIGRQRDGYSDNTQRFEKYNC
jgi:glycosyl transferase family 25